ncbi:MAG TPA: T9SS type A sorting domain-containing protein [Bacteroidia bacterium]|nr:T9SS type A sorting domain-containing protein [Bacteroidia bacterium]
MHKLLFSLLIISLNVSSQTFDGKVDSSFGYNGATFSNFDGGSNGLSYKLDSHKNIIACGQYFGAINYDFAAIKFDSLGKIDSTFGVNGKFIYSFGLDDYANSLLIQNDDKIILGGVSSWWDGFNINSIFNQFSVLRLHNNGSIDSTFGINGKFELDFDPIDIGVVTMGLQSDGKIIIVGKYNNGSSLQIIAIRLTQNGILDLGFGNSGITKIQLDTILKEDETTSCIVQQDDKILIGAITFDQLFSGRIFGMVRLTENGQLDSSFGNFGIVKTDIPYQGNDYALALALQSDGKILQAGTCKNNKIMAICRYNIDGTLDNTFGNQGIDTLNISLGKDIIRDIIVQDDNRILIVGETSSNACILRLTQYGQIDSTFNNTGINYFGNSTGETFNNVLLMNPNKIIAGGYAKDTNGVFQFSAVAFNSILFSGVNSIWNVNEELKIYPNPSRQWLNFSYLDSNVSISLIDFTGKIISQLYLNSNQQMDIGNLTNGIYFLQVQSLNKSQTIKFIKQ